VFIEIQLGALAERVGKVRQIQLVADV